MIISAYLCVKTKNSFTYNCQSFKDFNSANVYFRLNYNKTEIKDSTIIPVCNLNPFYKFELWYKLSKVFIHIKN